MKARYRYRIYPTPSQQMALAKLFGCVRVVWNDALAFCINQYKAGESKPNNSQLQKQFITQAKKVVEREWLSEVSCVPLQQSLNDLEQAYQNFFKSCKGQRKGKSIKLPKFKKRRAKQSARFTGNARLKAPDFRHGDENRANKKECSIYTYLRLFMVKLNHDSERS